MIKDNFGNNIERKLIGIKIAPLTRKIEKRKNGTGQGVIFINQRNL